MGGQRLELLTQVCLDLALITSGYVASGSTNPGYAEAQRSSRQTPGEVGLHRGRTQAPGTVLACTLCDCLS